MNEKDFLENYISPVVNPLNMTFAHPLPNIEGLEKRGDIILQSELEDTFATSIFKKYESDTLGINLLEMYRITQNKVTGVFARLVGTMRLVKTGYPCVMLDAPITNVDMFTARKEDIITRVRISLPQADPEQSKIFLSHLIEQAKEAGISCQELQFDQLPNFWGPMSQAASKGVDLGMIRKLRDYAWSAYKGVIEQTKEKTPFDYRPLQDFLMVGAGKMEQLIFGKAGLTFPVENQNAFFSVMVSGI